MIFIFFFRYCFEIATVLGGISFIFIEQGEEIKNSGIGSFWRNLVSVDKFNFDQKLCVSFKVF